VTVGAFPCYLVRVPEKAKNRGIVGGKLGEKGNRMELGISEARQDNEGTMNRAPTEARREEHEILVGTTKGSDANGGAMGEGVNLK
jgi:hypothetical protein